MMLRLCFPAFCKALTLTSPLPPPFPSSPVCHLQAPDAECLERFLGRLPLVMNVVIMSPHGYFGQSNVLGLPDTGGQVGSSSSRAGRQALAGRGKVVLLVARRLVMLQRCGTCRTVSALHMLEWPCVLGSRDGCLSCTLQAVLNAV